MYGLHRVSLLAALGDYLKNEHAPGQDEVAALVFLEDTLTVDQLSDDFVVSVGIFEFIHPDGSLETLRYVLLQGT